jgi:uracil phosphoribosyltransferase
MASKTTVLSSGSSIVTQYLHELRDSKLQKDSSRFENNLELLGMIAGYELSKQLRYVDHATKTPLGIANTPILDDKIVLSTILRAGLPVQRGIQRILQRTELAFIAAGRNPDSSGGVTINLAYVAAPDLTDKVLIIADTMLATGHSIVEAYQALIKEHGNPRQVFVVAVIAAEAGVAYVRKHLPQAELIVCAVDKELSDQYFIVPGLGDAGDLLYGPKL